MDLNEKYIDLKRIAEIPEKEFQQHFRDWMDRDDVARALQAKMRKDLIENFNKTSLGKKIISGSTTQRLTLSPLLLALNTLVAEFLYFESCHYSLSVFCTEIPYRNTLPDFENSQFFRFTEQEVLEILEALCIFSELKKTICNDYTENGNASLLHLIMKHICQEWKIRPTTTQLKSPTSGGQRKESIKPDTKTDAYNNNFRYLNRYLILLAKKVKDMSQQFDNLQNRKSIQTRKHENLGRNLERISENLRQMTISKRKSKNLSIIVTAIDAMTKQFEQCITQFSMLLTKKPENCQPSGVANEKFYLDWVKEILSSANGQKFLERIESALRKVIIKQKQESKLECDEKLRQQKEVLKLHYKQKLLEHITKNTPNNEIEYAKKLNDSVENTLKVFEVKHQELLKKIQQNDKPTEASEIGKSVNITKDFSNVNFKEIETQTDKKAAKNSVKISKPMQEVIETELQLHEMVKSIAEKEQSVDHIVFDAKMRIKELEHESNQLDQSFKAYLERQKLEKKASKDMVKSIWNSYAMEKSLLEKKCATRIQPANLQRSWKTEYKLPRKSQEPKHLNEKLSKKNELLTFYSQNQKHFQNSFRLAQEKVFSQAKILSSAQFQNSDQSEKLLCGAVDFEENEMSEMPIATAATLEPNELLAAASDVLFNSIPNFQMNKHNLRDEEFETKVNASLNRIQSPQLKEKLVEGLKEVSNLQVQQSAGEGNRKINGKGKRMMKKINGKSKVNSNAIACMDKLNAFFSSRSLSSSPSSSSLSSSSSSSSLDSLNFSKKDRTQISVASITNKNEMKTIERRNEIHSALEKSSKEQQEQEQEQQDAKEEEANTNPSAVDSMMSFNQQQQQQQQQHSSEMKAVSSESESPSGRSRSGTLSFGGAGRAQRDSDESFF